MKRGGLEPEGTRAKGSAVKWRYMFCGQMVQDLEGHNKEFNFYSKTVERLWKIMSSRERGTRSDIRCFKITLGSIWQMGFKETRTEAR